MSVPSLPVRALDLLASEWTKFRSVRSTYWSLLVAVVTPVAVSAVVAVAFANARNAGPPPDPLLPEVISLEYALIAVAVMGVLAFSAEYSTGHVLCSLNIPHTQLRDRLDEVRAAAAGRPVRVLCASGLRSAIAHRVLVQEGFDSASLSGGMLIKLDIKEGQKVNKGEILGVIDDTEYRADYLNTKARLMEAEAKLEEMEGKDVDHIKQRLEGEYTKK